MMNNVAKVAAGAVAGALLTTSALSWKGTANLKAAQKSAEAFKAAAIEFVNNAKTVETELHVVSGENTTLAERIAELEATVAAMDADAKDKKTLLDHTTNELNKANRELTKANEEAASYRKEMEELMDVSIFE